MAGSYPDNPGRRMAYDDDGTVVQGYVGKVGNVNNGDGVAPSNAFTAWSVANKEGFNNEDQTIVVSATSNSSLEAGIFVNLIFPELREIDGFYWNGRCENCQEDWLYSSSDTTNGVDGTWSAVGTQVRTNTVLYPDYRISINAVSVSNQRSISMMIHTPGSAFGREATLKRLHYYGEISAGETPDRLLFIDNSTSLEFTRPLDWGDVPRGTTLDFDVKVKNNSSTLTANTNLLDFEALYQTSDTYYTIKETGGSFATTLSITSIAAGVTYPIAGGDVITIRLTVSDAALLRLEAARLELSTVSWT